MVTESSAGPTVTNVKANGKTIFKRVKLNSYGVMDIAIKVIGKMASVTAKESSSPTMVAYSTPAAGAKTFSKEKANLTGPQMTHTRVHSSPDYLILHSQRMEKAL